MTTNNTNPIESNVPVLVSPMSVLHAKQSDSFISIHQEFMVIVLAFIFVLFLLKQF
jgi:hypothetical protein